MAKRRKRRNREKSPPTPTTVIRLGSQTHVGRVRSSNQDAYSATLAPNTPKGLDALLVVADGMGGHAAGEVASRMAVQGLARRLSTPKTAGGDDPTMRSSRAGILAEAIQLVNSEVFEAANKPETRGMGTTLTVAQVVGATLILGHVGDSRAYLLRDGELNQLTADHSWIAEQIAQGVVSPEAARSHPNRNLITRAIGIGNTVETDTLEIGLREKDVLLLCSDGLHGLVDDDEIAAVLRENQPLPAAEALVDRANGKGGNDNITVVVAGLERLSNNTDAVKRPADLESAETQLPTSTRNSNRSWFKRLFGRR